MDPHGERSILQPRGQEQAPTYTRLPSAGQRLSLGHGSSARCVRSRIAHPKARREEARTHVAQRHRQPGRWRSVTLVAERPQQMAASERVLLRWRELAGTPSRRTKTRILTHGGRPIDATRSCDASLDCFEPAPVLYWMIFYKGTQESSCRVCSTARVRRVSRENGARGGLALRSSVSRSRHGLHQAQIPRLRVLLSHVASGSTWR